MSITFLNQIVSLSMPRQNPVDRRPRSAGISWVAILVLCSVGCGRANRADDQAATPAADAVAIVAAQPPMFEIDAQDLLASRLEIEETRDGWVRLFDGHTFFGWEMASRANWRIEEGAIHVDSGDVGLLCTSVPWGDFELRMEIKAGETTNSGIFLRTPLSPQDPAVDCYELNVAPADNPFPTGSLVKRKRIDPVPPTDPDRWSLYEFRLVGDSLTVKIDGETVCDYVDPQPLPPGRIGLQHNAGPVAFRDIRIRPVGLSETLSADLSLWKQYPEMDGKFEMTDDGLLRVTGGRGQLESVDSFGDFVLHAEVKTASEKLNSGIFFRCIPGETMNGYECQINNDTVDGNPLVPADCGTGGIFRRQDARIVAAEDGQWFTMLLVAHQSQVAAWVNGLQVTDWKDTRPPHPNPRSGLRLEPGTLMIQAHDATTDLVFRRVDVLSLFGEAPAKTDDSVDESRGEP